MSAIQELLNSYYDVRREVERLKDIIDKMQREHNVVKQNYNYVLSMSQNSKSVTEKEKQAELESALKSVDDGIAKESAEDITKKLKLKVIEPKYNLGGGSVPYWGTMAETAGYATTVPVTTTPRLDDQNWG
jgi:predicted aldo/keto reductase-like oxidoreductase